MMADVRRNCTRWPSDGACSTAATSTAAQTKAAVGILVNGVTAWMFAGGQGDINLRGAFVHMASDALVAAGVVVAGFAILLTGWLWLDPVVSLAVNAVIISAPGACCATPSAWRWRRRLPTSTSWRSAHS